MNVGTTDLVERRRMQVPLGWADVRSGGEPPGVLNGLWSPAEFSQFQPCTAPGSEAGVNRLSSSGRQEQPVRREWRSFRHHP